MLVLLALGVHVAISMFVVGFLGFLAVSLKWEGSMGLLATTPYAVGAVFTFSVLPLFILMGHFAFHGGLTEGIYVAAYKWLGRLPGGLAIATTFACAAFAAASGSSLATAATFTRVSLPEMLKYGYDKRLASAVIATSGTLAIMIPPSAGMVIYGIITESSIARLLIAGIFPGLLGALSYIAVVLIRVKLNPSIAPKPPEQFTWGQRIRALKDMWALPILVLVVMGAIYTGVATPTEAGALGALGAFLIALSARRLNKQTIGGALLDTAQTTAMIFLIIIGAMVFGRFLAISRVGPTFVEFVTGADVPSIVVIIAFMFMYLVLGMFMDAVAMMAITLPIVFPVVMALGYSDVWFGVLVVKSVELGLTTPPVGMNVYVVKSVAGDTVALEDIFIGLIPFILADAVVISLLVAFPFISLWLPGTMFS